MEKLLMFFIVLSLASPLHAQLTLGRSPQPATPQAAEMTHYGDHGVNLYTGRVTVSIPIGEYKDKDFTVPVSLEYNYNGMRPNEQAAEPGLGWMLSCGGMITREVVGAADEGEMDAEGRQRSFTLYTYSGQTLYADIEPFDDIPFSSLVTGGVICGQLLTNNDKPDDALTVAYAISGHYYDASSDIYHFRMPGHSGSFYRRDDGTFAVFDTGDACGTYHVEKVNAPCGYGGKRSQITIITGDGYRYVFGSIESDDAYLDRLWLGKEPGAKKGTIIAWRLNKIISPGGRVLSFSYLIKNDDPNRSVQNFSPDRWVFSSSGSLNPNLFGTSVNSTYAPLEKIIVDGNTAVQFYYSEKDSLQSGKFLNGAGLNDLRPIYATRMLESITCDKVITHLSYSWNSRGNTYPFLTEIHTDGVGSWRMTYEGLTEGYFPPFWTVATDHWGYLNQTGESACSQQTVDWSRVSEDSSGPDYIESEPTNSCKLPDTLAVRLGLMSAVYYPTGGSTHFSYAANRYEKIVDKRRANDYHLRDIPETGVGPGVRIMEIENRDTYGTVTDARLFSYDPGRLLSYPRHQIRYSGRIYGSSPSYYDSVDVYYATTGTILRPGSVMLEYSSVTETRLDGSKTVHTFTSWTERPDEMTDIYTRMHRLSDGPGSNMIDTVSDIVNLRYVNRILEPRSGLQHFRGLPLKTAEYASGSSSPLQTVTLSYDPSEPEYRTEFTNVGEAYALVRRYAGTARATSRTTSTYYEQDSVTSVTCYSYNSRGQVIDERSSTSDGDSLRTTRTFPQDYPSDTTLVAMTDRNLVSYPVMEVQLRRRSGSSSWDTTAAVRYIYAFHANLLDSAFYAVSEVRRRQSVGKWVTESTFLYDNVGNIIQQTDADGISTSYVWNCVYGVSIIIENATRQEVESCLAQSPAVDITDTATAASRLRSALPQARVSDFDYKRYGLPTRMRDPAGHTFQYDYDDNNRLISIREEDTGIVQQYHYNTVTR